MRLIDADALKDKLERKADYYLDEWNLDGAEMLQGAIECVDDMPTVPRWISVADRLPEEDCFCLICTVDANVFPADFFADEDCFCAYETAILKGEHNSAAYWMPLSAPPERKES